MHSINNPTVIFLLEKELNDTLSYDSPVPKSKSKFKDQYWIWYDSQNPRHLSSTEGRLSINWDKYTFGTPIALSELEKELSGKLHNSRIFQPLLPREIIEDLKRLMIILLSIGHFIVTNTHRKKLATYKPYDPETAITLIKCCINFLSWVIREVKLEGRHINCLSGFRIKDIKQSIDTYPYIGINIPTSLKRIMSFFANPIVRKKLHSIPRWTSADISLIRWKKIRANYAIRRKQQLINKEDENLSLRGESNYLSLQCGMFVMISDYARAFVSDYLDSTGEEREDISDNNILKTMRDSNRCITQRFPGFQLINSKFLDSIELRIKQRRNGVIKSTANNTHTHSVENLPITSGEYNEIISIAREAAILLILAYTGMRYSELALIKISTAQNKCLVKTNGYWMLVSKRKKGSDNEAEWPAIDCTRDAIKVLERTSRFNGSDYLISGIKMTNRPLSNGSLDAIIYRFISRVDYKNKWVSLSKVRRGQKKSKMYPFYTWTEGIPPHPHRFRHTISSQLAAAGCGIPLITEQLKHLQGRLLDYNLNDITLGYGEQPEHLIAKVNGSACKQLFNEIEGKKHNLRADIFRSYYGEGRKFAGGGAEEHKKRVDSFFTGKALSGEDRDRYILKMSQSGMPLTPSAFGFCTNTHKTIDTASSTPCMGDLGCDPSCQHNVIPEEAAPKHINRLKQAIRMLRSPTQKPFKKNWQAVLERNKEYLIKLGIDACQIEHEYSIDLDKIES